ncbi:MAG: MSCRAMM family adhesin SdrC [Magnetococcus sp. WYHC-3]
MTHQAMAAGRMPGATEAGEPSMEEILSSLEDILDEHEDLAVAARAPASPPASHASALPDENDEPLDLAGFELSGTAAGLDQAEAAFDARSRDDSEWEDLASDAAASSSPSAPHLDDLAALAAAEGLLDDAFATEPPPDSPAVAHEDLASLADAEEVALQSEMEACAPAPLDVAEPGRTDGSLTPEADVPLSELEAEVSALPPEDVPCAGESAPEVDIADLADLAQEDTHGDQEPSSAQDETIPSMPAPEASEEDDILDTGAPLAALTNANNIAEERPADAEVILDAGEPLDDASSESAESTESNADDILDAGEPLDDASSESAESAESSTDDILDAGEPLDDASSESAESAESSADDILDAGEPLDDASSESTESAESSADDILDAGEPLDDASSESAESAESSADDILDAGESMDGHDTPAQDDGDRSGEDADLETAVEMAEALSGMAPGLADVLDALAEEEAPEMASEQSSAESDLGDADMPAESDLGDADMPAESDLGDADMPAESDLGDADMPADVLDALAEEETPEMASEQSSAETDLGDADMSAASDLGDADMSAASDPAESSPGSEDADMAADDSVAGEMASQEEPVSASTDPDLEPASLQQDQSPVLDAASPLNATADAPAGETATPAAGVDAQSLRALLGDRVEALATTMVREFLQQHLPDILQQVVREEIRRICADD